MDSEFFEKRQEEIDKDLKEEQAKLELPIEYSLHITPLGKEARFKMKEPYFSILDTLEGLEKQFVTPDELISKCKSSFVSKSSLVEALKHLVQKGYVCCEEL